MRFCLLLYFPFGKREGGWQTLIVSLAAAPDKRDEAVFMHKKAVSHFMGKFAGEVEIGSTPQGCQIFKNTSEFLCKFI
jgi:hypothetical protein